MSIQTPAQASEANSVTAGCVVQCEIQDFDGKLSLATGEVAQLKNGLIMVVFSTPVVLSGDEHDALWLPRSAIRQVVHPASAAGPSQPALANATAGQPPSEEPAEASAPSTAPASLTKRGRGRPPGRELQAKETTPADGPVIRPCKKCGQGVDITGLKGKAIGAAMGRHGLMACPVMLAARKRRSDAVASPADPPGPPALTPRAKRKSRADAVATPPKQSPPPTPEPAIPSSEPRPTSLDALPALLREMAAWLAGLRSLAGEGIRFRLEITNIE